MNFENPVAALFPGAAGRTVSELTRRHMQGEDTAEAKDVAAGAAVAHEQFVKVATRLAMMGLLQFPVRDQVTLVRENIMWFALAEMLEPRAHLDSLVWDAVQATSGVETVVISGPVPAGTAESFPEGISVAIVAPEGVVSEAAQKDISRKVSHGLGNDCTVVVAATTEEAMDLIPEEGQRIIDSRPHAAR